jgi:hypothetical protein
MGIERVVNELSSLGLNSNLRDNVRKIEWPLLVLQDLHSTFNYKVLHVRTKLQEIFPDIVIQIITVKSTKVGATIGKLTEVSDSILGTF